MICKKHQCFMQGEGTALFCPACKSELRKGKYGTYEQVNGAVANGLMEEVERLNVLLESADKYNATLEKCVARRRIEIAELRDKHVAMMLRKEFNLPKAG